MLFLLFHGGGGGGGNDDEDDEQREVNQQQSKEWTVFFRNILCFIVLYICTVNLWFDIFWEYLWSLNFVRATTVDGQSATVQTQ